MTVNITATKVEFLFTIFSNIELPNYKNFIKAENSIIIIDNTLFSRIQWSSKITNIQQNFILINEEKAQLDTLSQLIIIESKFDFINLKEKSSLIRAFDCNTLINLTKISLVKVIYPADKLFDADGLFVFRRTLSNIDRTPIITIFQSSF